MDDEKSKRRYDVSSKHKHKKKKHHHKKKKRDTRSDSNSSEGSETEWVEAPIPDAMKSKDRNSTVESENNKSKRDDWMQEEMFVSTFTKNEIMSGSSRQKKLEAQAIIKEKEEAIQNQRELNPHWKNNGTGLPEKHHSSESLTLPSTSVGDGGYSYLKKAYYRIQEQSQQESRSMEEIAVERWGSLDKLKSLIKEAEDRMNENSRTRYSSDRYKYDDRLKRKSYSRPKSPADHKSSPSQSPERSYRYEKPKYHSKKVGHYSSSDHKRTKGFKLTEYASSNSEDESFKKQKHEYKDSKIPAWKKRRPSEEEDRKQDLFVWDRHQSDKKKSEYKSSKQIPSWKKTQESQSTEKTFSASKAMSSEEEDNIHSIENKSEKAALPNVTSEDDLNKLAARVMKAELLGDKALASELKMQLENAREVLKGGGDMQSCKRQRESVLLTKLDSSGQERPIYYNDDVRQAQSKQKKKQSQKFFDDGSRYSLKQMFEREKLTTTDDNIEMFMEVAAKCKEEDDENETSGISKKATNKMAHHLQEEKDVGRAIRQHQKRTSALEKCCYCLDQPNMKRHLIISKSNLVYLCVPEFQSIVEGHCLIVPKRHVPSCLALDEEEWVEIEDLKLQLRNMFYKQNKNVILLETSRSFKYHPHAFLEVIPVPEEISDEAPLYFKKAILESETEWANNIKLIDLSKKSLRHSVPKNLPYFCVQFDPKVHPGYAHVIEDERHFERNFGKEVIGGMMDIDYNNLFKNRKEDPTKKSKETLQFINMYNDFVRKSP